MFDEPVGTQTVWTLILFGSITRGIMVPCVKKYHKSLDVTTKIWEPSILHAIDKATYFGDVPYVKRKNDLLQVGCYGYL